MVSMEEGMVMMCLIQQRKQPKAKRDKPELEESSAIIRGNDTGDDNYHYC